MEQKSENLMNALEALKTQGLSFSQCVKAFAAEEGDLFHAAARRTANDEFEVDDCAVVSRGDGGAWVSSWTWVSNESAGALLNSEMLEQVWNYASKLIEKVKANQDGDLMSLSLQDWMLAGNYADWLEDLISNYADEVDEIESEPIMATPGTLVWMTADGTMIKFMPSSALNRLRLIARLGGLPDHVADQAEEFSVNFGNKMDCILRAYCAQE